MKNPIAYTLTYAHEDYKNHDEDAEEFMFEELGSGIEFDVLEVYSKNGTTQIDVAVPDTVAPEQFVKAETVAEAGYTFE